MNEHEIQRQDEAAAKRLGIIKDPRTSGGKIGKSWIEGVGGGADATVRAMRLAEIEARDAKARRERSMEALFTVGRWTICMVVIVGGTFLAMDYMGKIRLGIFDHTVADKNAQLMDSVFDDKQKKANTPAAQQAIPPSEKPKSAEEWAMVAAPVERKIAFQVVQPAADPAPAATPKVDAAEQERQASAKKAESAKWKDKAKRLERTVEIIKKDVDERQLRVTECLLDLWGEEAPGKGPRPPNKYAGSAYAELDRISSLPLSKSFSGPTKETWMQNCRARISNAETNLKRHREVLANLTEKLDSARDELAEAKRLSD